MGKIMMAVRFLLVAGAMMLFLAACGGSNSSSSSAASTTAKSEAWTNVSVRAFDEKININWDKPAGSFKTASGSALIAAEPAYNIYCSTNPADIMQDSNRIATNFTGQSFDHTNVTNGERYYYAVTEVGASGEGPASLIVSATPQKVQPAAPYGLKATVQDSAAKLEFMGPTPPGNVIVSYNLYRSTTRDFTADITKTPMTTIATPYSDSNLKNGTTYYYALKAVVSGKESEFSPAVSVRPQATVAPVDFAAAVGSSSAILAAFGSPADMTAEPGNGSCIISWTSVADLVKASPDPDVNTSAKPYYILYWSDSPDVLKNVKGQIDNTAKNLTKDANGAFTYKLTGLNNGAMYYLQLVAAVKGSDGNPIEGRFTSGPVVSVTPALKTPAIPSGVSATQGTQQVSLSWSKDSSGIPNVTYNIYFSTTEYKNPTELVARGIKKNNDDPAKAYYTHSGLQSGKTYYYVVTAIGEGESAPSNIISVSL